MVGKITELNQPTSSPNLHKLILQLGKSDFRGRVIAFDPGETTGWACFFRDDEQTVLLGTGQIKTWPLEGGLSEIESLLTRFSPNFLVLESYSIYDWKLEQHSFHEVPTIQIIGMIKTLCYQRALPWMAKSALEGKHFCTDRKLEYWGLYFPGLQHSRDAIRHACRFLLFDGRP